MANVNKRGYKVAIPDLPALGIPLPGAKDCGKTAAANTGSRPYIVQADTKLACSQEIVPLSKASRSQVEVGRANSKRANLHAYKLIN